MIEKSKLQELKERITEKENEIISLKEQRANSAEPEEMALLDKKIADTSKTLVTLEKTRKAVTYEPPKPTEKQLLLSGLNEYLYAKKEAVKKRQNQIRKIEEDLQLVDGKLKRATETGDIDEVVQYAEKQEELEKYLEYADKMKKAVENKPPFTSEEVLSEWEAICKEKQPDFTLLLSRIGLLAEEYRNACKELVEMNNMMVEVRREIKSIANANGVNVVFYPILTVGIDAEPLKISKADGMKPGFVINGSNGKAL